MIDDPTIKGVRKVTHRDFLMKEATYKSVAKITDPSILKDIQFNFRLLYLRDSVLASQLEERNINLISTIILLNYMDIVKYVTKTEAILTELFDNLKA